MFGDLVSPLWIGQILVAANLFGVWFDQRFSQIGRRWRIILGGGGIVTLNNARAGLWKFPRTPRTAHGATMTERLMFAVTYDPARGYVTTDTEEPRLSALSLAGLRRQLGAAYADAEIILTLDKRARSERDARRKGGHGGAEQWRRW